ncbi:MAG: hypothetical protein AAFX87_17055 [Bacteroidota bacterium]
MDFKPDESSLIAYLYGELAPEERQEVEAYLAENPEVQKELEGLQEVRNIMGKLPDKEVIAPEFVWDAEPVMVSGKSTAWYHFPWMRTVMGVAASVIIILLLGYLTDLNIAYNNNELRIAFGQTEPRQESDLNDRFLAKGEALTADDVKALVEQELNDHNALLTSKIDSVGENMQGLLAKNQISQADIKNVLAQQANTYQVEVQQYVSQMKEENIKMINSFFEVSVDEQKEYMSTLLNDFAEYVQNQRQEDLIYIQTRFEDLKEDNSTYQVETDQILASIINTVNNSSQTQNN